jgi:hypothetical protein
MAQQIVMVSKYISDVERTPIFTDGQHSLEGVQWDLGPNKVTDKGL